MLHQHNSGRKFRVNVAQYMAIVMKSYHFCTTMTSSNGNFFRVTGPLWGGSTGHKRLGKQSRRCWFETPSRSLWRHCSTSDWGCFMAVVGGVRVRRVLFTGRNQWHLGRLDLHALDNLIIVPKQKYRHFDEIRIIACAGSCHNDNFRPIS